MENIAPMKSYKKTLTTKINKEDLILYKNFSSCEKLEKEIRSKDDGNEFKLPPPNPLLPRKYIPVSSPKFGKNFKYIKLEPFIANELENDMIEPNSNFVNPAEKFEKNWNIENYANSQKFYGNLVYYKNRKNKEKDFQILIKNIVNLKKNRPNSGEKPIYTLEPYYKVTGEDDKTIIFESRFESGNLLAASKIADFEYHLIIQNDTNTVGYNQWFFFRVKNISKGTTIRLNILNMKKPRSMYQKGMKILIYSQNKAKYQNVGWYRGGDFVQYYRNGLFLLYNEKKHDYSSLCFSYTAEYDDDTVFFANSIPYTYSDLTTHLNEFEKDENKYPFVLRRTVCCTLAGNNLDSLTITNRTSSLETDTRPAICLMSRVHPGETVSSWMMKGIIEFLTSEHEDAVFLRNNYVIKLIPMLNPDGVIVGNYRTSLAGCDLNRRWLNPSEILYPEVFYPKEMIMKMSKQRDFDFICDLHGHSNQFDVFTYGNKNESDPLINKVYPLMLSKINKFFNFNYCNEKMPKSKKGTARINLYSELKEIPNIFTLEASFAGVNIGDGKKVHMNTIILNTMGRDICRAIVNYNRAREEAKLNELNIKKQDLAFNNTDILNELNKYNKTADDSFSGESSSEDSEDNLGEDELVGLMPKHKRKFKKSQSMKKIKKFEPIIRKPSKVVNPPPEEKKPVPVPAVRRRSPKAKTLVYDMRKKIYPDNRRDEDSQTEDIFFKMPWTFFKNKFKIITPQISTVVKIEHTAVEEKKIITPLKHNSTKLPSNFNFFNNIKNINEPSLPNHAVTPSNSNLRHKEMMPLILNKSSKDIKQFDKEKRPTPKTISINNTSLKAQIVPLQSKPDQDQNNFKNLYKYYKGKNELSKLVKYFETD